VASGSESGVRLTWFDTPERSPADELAERAAAIARTPMVTALLDGYPQPVIVVDRNRQIVACNRAALAMFGGVPIGTLIGQRPGEALHCIHATEMAAGCGTSEFCTECGAAQALRASREQHSAEIRECRIMVHATDGDAALDLRVQASPLNVDGAELTLFAIQDIADEKRRQALERIFFHDVLNTANGIDGVARMIPSTDDPAALSQLSQLLQESSGQLIKEIISQRDLLDAERGDLAINLQQVPAGELLRAVHRLYLTSMLLDGRSLTHVDAPPAWIVNTDPVQAVRCLGNLVKNAIEATPAGRDVSLWAERGPGVVRFRVRNPGVMAQSVQRQMFYRSFSTKAARGRGIGSYSVKLLVERYLHGSVSFESNDRVGGTVFTLALPAVENDAA
jgi:signal transduction histidine kinase